MRQNPHFSVHANVAKQEAPDRNGAESNTGTVLCQQAGTPIHGNQRLPYLPRLLPVTNKSLTEPTE